jgi:hypothetical protein
MGMVEARVAMETEVQWLRRYQGPVGTGTRRRGREEERDAGACCYATIFAFDVAIVVMEHIISR